MPASDWRERTVLTVEEARVGPFDGTTSSAAIYAGVKSGKIPSVHLGAKVLIPVKALKVFLHERDGEDG
jgi:hypothetical protein